MISFPGSKINLGLHILRKRNDGYHDLETIFYPIPLNDVLEIVENKGAGKSFSIPFTGSGLRLEGDASSNLCVKAYRLLKRDFPRLPFVKMHLHKLIPAGGGLGGGSSDGAFTLKMLNEMFGLALNEERLRSYAGELGSDCPFFIMNKPAYATGRGETLEHIELDLSPYRFVIVNPGIHISTGRAFLDVKPRVPERSLKQVILDPIERWKDSLSNDFEKKIFQQYAEIVEVKDELYRCGAIYASMTGSGSTVYGIFSRETKIVPDFPAEYFVKVLN